MSLLDIKTAGDVRAFLHAAVPTVAAALVSYGVLTEAHSALWVALALAILDPAVSALNTANGFRKFFYPVLAAASALLIGYGIKTGAELAPLLSIVTILVGGGVAAANTPTSAAVASE